MWCYVTEVSIQSSFIFFYVFQFQAFILIQLPFGYQGHEKGSELSGKASNIF